MDYEELDILIEGLIDQQLDDSDLRRLDELLLQDRAARDYYAKCISMHVLLLDHFDKEKVRIADCCGAKHIGISDPLV